MNVGEDGLKSVLMYTLKGLINMYARNFRNR